MIILTKLDKSKILVSLDAIKFIESTPDSLIRFINGDTMVVMESLQEITERVIEFKKKYIQNN